MKVIITEEAEQSLDEIIEYLRIHWNQNVIDKFISNIQLTIQRIQKFPKSFPVSPFIDAQRALVSKQIIMLFKIEGNVLIIYLFWDARQNPQKLNIK
ncbi:MAG: type II toxin-antitoxin system RelE/ParE family toxin [Sphingobacteriales bacterium]|jgi:plasmid stabilization system protein ParE|nr:MAG: type II toxin-antitoxin system RelE/ParE family toxin [Sphingobacteriales bacterium]